MLSDSELEEIKRVQGERIIDAVAPFLLPHESVKVTINGQNIYPFHAKLTFSSSRPQDRLYFNEGGEFGTFSVEQQTNCCGIMVTTQTYVNSYFRRRGICKRFQKMKEAIAKRFCYTTMLATVPTNAEEMTIIMKKDGWESTYEFVNRNSDNRVVIWVKEVNYK